MIDLIFNPETEMIHINPHPDCNVHNARKDPGPKPHHISNARLVELIKFFNAKLCSRCVRDNYLDKPL